MILISLLIVAFIILFPYEALTFSPTHQLRPIRSKRSGGVTAATAKATRTRIHLSDHSKWDSLVDEDDDDDGYETSDVQVPADMKYALPNIKRQSDTFDALRGMGDAELISDVWLQSPADSTAWFVGRVARVSDISVERAIDRQYPLIERHSWTLRPVDLHPRRGPFLVFHAPGDTEELVAAGDSSVRLIRVEEDSIRDDNAAPVKTVEVGFKGAAYDDANEDSFRTDLNLWARVEEDDDDIEHELNGFAIPATPEEDAEMQAPMADKLQAKDIDKFFDDYDWKKSVDKSFPSE